MYIYSIEMQTVIIRNVYLTPPSYIQKHRGLQQNQFDGERNSISKDKCLKLLFINWDDWFGHVHLCACNSSFENSEKSAQIFINFNTKKW